MIRLALVVLAAAVLAAPAAAARALVVHGDTRIDSYRVRADGTLAGALRAFGKPTTKQRIANSGVCAVNWHSRGMLITFYNLAGKNPCAARTGFFGSAILTGSRWQTALGLRIGARAAAIRQRHPLARRATGRGAGWWWLVKRSSQIGTHGLEARVERGRVTAFRVTHQAGGE